MQQVFHEIKSDTPIKYKFGIRLRDVRMNEKITLALLAQQIGISTPTIGKYEKGTIMPSPIILVRLADACSIILVISKYSNKMIAL